MYLKYPVNYILITQYYQKGVHNGVDLAWSSSYGGENTPIYAPGDGVVVNVKSDYIGTSIGSRLYGNYVKIKHENNIYTLCAHMKEGSVTLKVGDKVSMGDQIGLMGNTGDANGNHVHYEVFEGNVKVNPEDYTYVYPSQIVSTNPAYNKGLKYYLPEPPTPEPTPTPEPDPEIDELKKQIQILEDKNALQAKEIESLKEQLSESGNYTFEYPVLKTSLYEIKLNEGETLLIK